MRPAVLLDDCALVGSDAALVKKKGGYTNTKTHGNLMSAAVLLALGGWYVIYSRKEMLGKPHVQSW